MSQDLSNGQSGERDISRTATEGNDRKNYEGFEGMNYEQIRQPYNPKHKGRNSPSDERKDKRPGWPLTLETPVLKSLAYAKERGCPRLVRQPFILHAV